MISDLFEVVGRISVDDVLIFAILSDGSLYFAMFAYPYAGEENYRVVLIGDMHDPPRGLAALQRKVYAYHGTNKETGEPAKCVLLDLDNLTV